MRLRDVKVGEGVPVHPRVRESVVPGVLRAWISGVSASTTAVRMHDLRLFGACVFGFDDASRTIFRVIETLQTGIGSLHALARTWMDAQRSSGLTHATRQRRWFTLQSLVKACERERVVPKGVALPAMDRDLAGKGDTIDLVNDAVRVGMTQRRFRDVAIVCLAWENGATLAAMQALRAGDLPIACSERCADALAIVASDRPATAYVFPGRDASKPTTGETLCRVFDRYGLPGLVRLRKDRARYLRSRELLPDDPLACYVLAGER